MKKILIFMLKLYQKNISPIIKYLNSGYDSCKYIPTCSEYTKQAIIKYGSIKGSWKGLKRIFRCNPFSKGGYDPLK